MKNNDSQAKKYVINGGSGWVVRYMPSEEGSILNLLPQLEIASNSSNKRYETAFQ